MFSINGKDIAISKGDTGIITITLTGEVPDNNTIALVTVRENVNTCNVVWEKRLQVNNGVIIIDLTSEETDIPAHTYVWDFRLLYSDGGVYTPFQPAKYQIYEVVGDV